MLKANLFATCDCEISWSFSLALTGQSLLIFESYIIIHHLLNQLEAFNDVITDVHSGL